MTPCTREKYRQWVYENEGKEGVHRDATLISEPPCVIWFKGDVLMARMWVGDTTTFELSETAVLCEHTFGHIDNQDAGRHIVEGKKNLKLYYNNRMKDFEPFTYCPDCGALLAPIIAGIVYPK